MRRMTKQLLVPSAVYCLTCFTIAQLLYSIILITDPVDFRLSPRGWVASFILEGAITTIYCSSGLAGLWLLIYSTVALPRDHVKTAVLIAAIASSVFFFEFALAEDHLWQGAAFVAGTSVAIAMVVRTYAQSRIA